MVKGFLMTLKTHFVECYKINTQWWTHIQQKKYKKLNNKINLSYQ